ncbi:MAG: glycoside hydrolase family 95 protein, partial [Sphingobacteriaceae bacterium]
MNTLYKLIFFGILICGALSSRAQSNTYLKLWYNKPAGDSWTDALPIGNGRLGAMVYGNTEQEIIKLNETTVWSGSPSDNNNPDALQALPGVRKLLFEGKYKEAQNLAEKNIQAKENHGMMYQPVGNLHLNFSGHANPEYYYRELNLDDAVATTIYTINGVQYKREVFSSIPGQVIVVRLKSSKRGMLDFTAFLSS